MSALEVTFPDEWLTMPMKAAGGVTTLMPTPDELDFDGRASLALLSEYGGDPVRAFCAVGAVPGGRARSCCAPWQKAVRTPASSTTP